MSGTQVVYITRRQLVMLRADRLTYHAPKRWDWHRTVCGIAHEREGAPITTALRWDTAYLIASPCRTCFGESYDG